MRRNFFRTVQIILIFLVRYCEKMRPSLVKQNINSVFVEIVVMQKVLITGGLGYIGSNTVVELADASFDPIIADNLSNSDAAVLESLEEIVAKKLSFHRIDVTGCDSLYSAHVQKFAKYI